MSDLMTFPDTVEEFMENYKIVDSEQIYTNGAEMVPIFRMIQWFEHLPSAQPAPCEFCKHNNIADDKACLMCSAERRTDDS